MSPVHKRGPALTDVEIAKILSLDHAGYSQRAIVEEVNRSKGAVQHTLDKYEFESFNGKENHETIPRKTTKREDRYLIRAAKQFPDVPLHDISNIVTIPVSASTVSRRIHEVGLGRYVQVKKSALSPKNIEERLR